MSVNEDDVFAAIEHARDAVARLRQVLVRERNGGDSASVGNAVTAFAGVAELDLDGVGRADDVLNMLREMLVAQPNQVALPESFANAIVKSQRMTGCVQSVNGEFVGNGVMIAPSLFLTAEHVHSNQNTVIRFQDGKSVDIHGVAYSGKDVGHDWLAYALKRPAGNDLNGYRIPRGWVSIPVSSRMVEQDFLFVIHSQIGMPMFSPGLLTKVSASGERIDYRATTFGGSSGAPLFDMGWKFLGIHTDIGYGLTAGAILKDLLAVGFQPPLPPLTIYPFQLEL